MNKFQELVDLCKGSVMVWANDYQSCYETIEENMEEFRSEISDEIWAKIIETKRVYRIQAYPVTPIGFEMVFHYDFDLAVEEALNLVKRYTKS